MQEEARFTCCWKQNLSPGSKIASWKQLDCFLCFICTLGGHGEGKPGCYKTMDNKEADWNSGIWRWCGHAVCFKYAGVWKGKQTITGWHFLPLKYGRSLLSQVRDSGYQYNTSGVKFCFFKQNWTVIWITGLFVLTVCSIYRIFRCISRPFKSSKSVQKIDLDLYTGQNLTATWRVKK